MTTGKDEIVVSRITSQGPALDHFIDGIAYAFARTELTRAFITEIDQTLPPNDDPNHDDDDDVDGGDGGVGGEDVDGDDAKTIPHERLVRHFGPAIRQALIDGAEIVYAGRPDDQRRVERQKVKGQKDEDAIDGDAFSALAVWETTSYRGLSFQETQVDASRRIRIAARDCVAALKRKYIGLRDSPSHHISSTETQEPKKEADGEGRKDERKEELNPFYHLSFLARDPRSVPHPNCIRAVVAPYLRRARDENVPVWLEATQGRAVQVYLSFGFRVVEEYRVGTGYRNAEGWPERGGEGVVAFAMIYDPHLSSSRSSS